MKHVVMLVDTDTKLLDFATAIWREFGWETIVAISVFDALQIIKKLKRLDVFIAEINMSDLPGDELFRNIMTLFPESFRVLVSTNLDFDKVCHLMDTGIIVKAYQKPFPLQDVYRRTRDLIKMVKKEERD